MNTGKFSPRSRLKSFKYAFRGLGSLLKFEHNSRIHLFAAIIVVILGIILKVSVTEWCILILAIGFVFFAELLNSSAEAFSDAVKPGWDEKIMKAKDYASAAVLVAAITSAVIGILIFLPRLILLF
ncbi:MAG TPA: diacylglycerol kinase family protein [Bacteroidales bacterium]|jgi:diacylglycerol kinase|nr:diacylglycerol kinase family protein [Bacteroidales bacterium]HOS72130.1 diacylglycerol kinase family protein [Bacteroidales bacterium]HQH25489.1 diacylglycerol kinase family protein [Bacteroidales bacterium]HQJ83009.1 diacylglycerol kinase family protein [Bacteroidales bacterium]